MTLQAVLRSSCLFSLLFAMMVGLSGCGKKPGGLDKPDMVLSTYPQKYPKTETIPGTGPQFSEKTQNTVDDNPVIEERD